MRKVFAFILVGLLSLTFMPAPTSASFLAEINGVEQDHIITVNFTGANTLTRVAKKLTLPVVDATLIAGGAANGGATSMTTATLAIPVTFGYVNMAISQDTADTSFLSKTLANGKTGQFLTLHIYQNIGGKVITITPTTATGWVTATMNAVDDELALLYLNDTDGWVRVGSTSVTFTTF